MRRIRASKRGQWLSLFLAGVVGFLLGDWHATTIRSTRFALSPSQNVSLRFPEAKADTAAADTVTAGGAPGVMVLGDPQLALLNPNPMVPPRPRPAPQAEAPTQASAEPATAAPAQTLAATPRPAPTAKPQHPERQSAAENASRHAERPRVVLNDAQIASIKARLQLTPDQERMWPAVEAALRTIAYAKAHGAPAANDMASLNADSAEVQGLKSAAVPLIMSFSDEQKNEVRNLAHVMGLDKLAAEF